MRLIAPIVFLASTCAGFAETAPESHVTFRDVTAEVGLAEVKASWSSAWGDLDGDGWLDLATVAHVKNLIRLESHVFRNDRGRFVDITRSGIFPETGFATAMCAHAVTFCDINADGRLDLLTSQEITKDYFQPDLMRSNELLIAQPDGRFVDVAERAGLTGKYLSRGIYFYDFDRDGRLDLLLPCSDMKRPEGNFNLLFRNQGNLAFEEISATAGIRHEQADLRHKVAVIADFNGDGWPDIFTLHPGFLFLNRGDGTFRDTTAESGITTPPRTAPWHKGGACAFDFDNDGLTDLAIAEGNRGGRSKLYRNRGYGTFEDVTTAAGILHPWLSYSVTAGDYDNDGWLDLYFGTIDRPSRDAAVHGPNALFRNNGDGTFTNVTEATGTAAQTAGGACDVMFVDYDNDGFLDLFTTNGESNQVGPVVLLRNAGNRHHWLQLRLVGQGENIHGIGARVSVTTADLKQTRDYTGPIHLMSQDNQPLHFGLGRSERIATLEILWPSGRRHVLRDVAANQFLTVREADAF
jgi:ASPIC and UnbV.